MYNTSDAYKNAIIQPNRRFKLGGWIYLRNGETIATTDDNVSADDELMIETQSVSGTASEKSFDVGAVPAAELTMTVIDDGDVHNFSGAKLEINVSLQLEDGTWEKVPMGIFYIDGSSIEHVGNRITFTAYDAMIKLHYLITDEMRSALTGKTAAEAAQYLADFAVPFEQDLSGFLNSDVIVDFGSAQVKKGRDGIMWIAQLMGCFARINRLGYLEFVQLSVPWNPDSMLTFRLPSREVTADQRITTKAADDRISVSSVSMSNDSGKIVTAYALKEYETYQNMPVELEKNPLLKGKSDSSLREILLNIVYILMTIKFTPGRTEIANDPAIDAGDLIEISKGGDVTSSFVDFYVTHNVWRYCGRHEIISASAVPVVYDGDEAAAVSVLSDDGISVQSEENGLGYANPESQSSLAAAAASAGGDKAKELVGAFNGLSGDYVFKWISPYEIAAVNPQGEKMFYFLALNNGIELSSTQSSSGPCFEIKTTGNGLVIDSKGGENHIELAQGNITIRSQSTQFFARGGGYFEISAGSGTNTFYVNPSTGYMEFKAGINSFFVNLPSGEITINGKKVKLIE